MKKYLFVPFLSLLLGAFCFASCSSNKKTSHHSDNSGDTSNPDSGSEDNPDNPDIIPTYSKGKTILHCFDWSMTNIKNSLNDIKNAGFDTIQISPMQPQKDPYSGNWKNQWWKLYQPLGFKVATGGENILGTKSDLIDLCSEADNKGIDVIVDVVANHLASASKGLYSAVQGYEPVIYNNNLIHTTGKSIDDDVIWGNMGDLCDLKTEDNRVQERVLSLLKEYVDCGIDGFRFDAAKHIETEFDSVIYRSDFWKNTLDAAKTYAKNTYNRELFSYGEILGTVGTGRNYNYYTCRMSITDSDQSSDALKAARGNTSFISDSYNTNEKATNLVIWSESHDTYSNDWGESKDDDLSTIQKGYVMQASRKESSILYFARPLSTSNLGEIGDLSYKNNEVKAINSFRDKYGTKGETVSSSNGCFVNVRGSSSAVIVRLSGNNTQIEVPGLANGSYKDSISGNNFVCNNGVITLPSGTTYCILESDNDDVIMPSISLNYNEVYSETQNVMVTTKNASSITYSINGSSEQTLDGSVLSLPNSLPNGKVSLKVKATNSNGVVSKTINMIKTSTLMNKELIITDCDSNYSYYLWTWIKDDGKWRSVTVDGDMIGCDLNGDTMFIVVKFAKGTTTPNWDNKISQTGNVAANQRIYSYLDLPIE